MGTEKQQLDYKYNLLPPEYTETEVEDATDVKSFQPYRSETRRDVRCITCITLVLFVAVGILGCIFLVSKAANDGIQYKFPFKGNDNVESMQHVASYVADNVVEYSVVRPSELFTIMDNFNLDLQIMKIESEEETVCYVTHLNRTSAVEPSAVSPEIHNLDGQPVYNQNTFMTAELPVDDTTFLGRRGEALCLGAPVYWIHPMSDSDYKNFDIPTKYNTSALLGETSVVSREKRNVKKCVASCCQLVCCCNQRWLSWTLNRNTRINCHNLCAGCTFLSRKQIRKTYLCVN